MAQASVSDALWTSFSGGVPGMPCREETRRNTQDWSVYVTWLAWEHLGILIEELEEVFG